MTGQIKNKGLHKDWFIQRIARLEQLVSQVDAAQKNASRSYHYSELAERSLSNATAALTEAVKKVSLGQYEKAERLQNVTWFYAKFAQDIVGAESTEHLLGNDCFLDLIEPASKVRARLVELISDVREAIDEYYADIPESWESDGIDESER